MADYRLTAGPEIIRTADGATIPADPGNVDYQAFLAWLAVPNTPDPIPPSPPADTVFGGNDAWQF